MSNLRQDVTDANQLIRLTPNQLLSRVFELARDEHDEAHSHPWHQLLLPRKGMLRTRTPTDIYFIPSNRAALIPAGSVHESWALTDAQFAGIYFDPALFPYKLTECRIIEVTDFLDLLVSKSIDIGFNVENKHTDRERRILSVLMDEIAESPAVNLSVTVPDEKRLLPIVKEILTHPSSSKSLESWAKTAGASERTISRLFQKHTGLGFARWRQKVRMVSALSMLEENIPIQQIALNVGYGSASAFTFAFRQEFGLSPQRYLGGGVGSSNPSFNGSPSSSGAAVGAT